ncbi:hypothetical protein CK485_26500 [Streptomyces sp. ICBB 8177]|nr:hypothetical protein CK485_26500 [Streptomyces sp. ICBB 8177]
MLVVNPCAGTAEMRQTAFDPMRTVTWPPTDCTVCTPTPPSQSAPWYPCEDGADDGCGEGGRRDGGGLDGAGCADGDTGADLLGSATAVPISGDAEAPASALGTAGAVGGRGEVDPTTKRTARKTAVTVRAVQDSQTRR